MSRGPYMNEDGDWWVAVEDASFREARAEVVGCLGYTIPDDGTLLYRGREVVRLSDHEVELCDDEPCAEGCRRVEAWHFVENPRDGDPPPPRPRRARHPRGHQVRGRPAPTPRRRMADGRWRAGVCVSDRLTYRPKELPAMLGVSRTQVYAWLKAGVIPSVTIGGTVLIPKADFEAWLASLQRRSRA